MIFRDTKRIVLSFVLFATALVSYAQAPEPIKPDSLMLWPSGAPNAFEIPGPESGFITFRAKEYETAYLEVYPARNPTGLCVIMCPGGAYILESQEHEGRDLKDWFNTRGITYCMLQYRLPCGHHEVPLSDVQQAMRIMRSKAEEYGFSKICIAGNSAGGHLAACAATMYDSPLTRPDFQFLMYPVITMEASFTNMMSRDALLGKNPSQDLVDRYSCEKNVTADTPPAFIFLCSDDPAVPPANSLRYYEALIANGVSTAMHIYPFGAHGFGWDDTMRFKANWVHEFETWLETIVYPTL